MSNKVLAAADRSYQSELDLLGQIRWGLRNLGKIRRNTPYSVASKLSKWTDLNMARNASSNFYFRTKYRKWSSSWPIEPVCEHGLSSPVSPARMIWRNTPVFFWMFYAWKWFDSRRLDSLGQVIFHGGLNRVQLVCGSVIVGFKDRCALELSQHSTAPWSPLPDFPSACFVEKSCSFAYVMREICDRDFESPL